MLTMTEKVDAITIVYSKKKQSLKVCNALKVTWLENGIVKT